MAVVSAVPRVMVSSPVPPVMVSMLATVAVLAKLPRVSVSLPAPRSMEPLATAAARVTVSAPVPPVRVSTLADGGGVGAVGQGELVGAGAEIDGAAARGAERDCRRGSAGRVSTLATVTVLPKLPR